MNQSDSIMSKTVSVITRVAPEVKEKLQALAKSTKRSEAYLAREAIEAYVEHNAWQVKEIKEALDAVMAGEPGIPHEDVERWLASKGASHELPMPTIPTSKRRR